MPVVDTEIFKARATAKHGGFYDYSKSIYTTAKSLLTITCPIHGDFQQQAYLHTKGYGCKQCGIRKVADIRAVGKDRMIERSRNRHGDKYNYDKVVYHDNMTKVIITCRIHGDFEQRPLDHWAGQGCRLCGINKRVCECSIKFDELEQRGTELYGGKYKYVRTEITNGRSYARIICPVHGPFIQSVVVHLSGHQCPKCKKEEAAATHRHTLDEFIAKANLVHINTPGRYNYDKVIYRNCKSKVTITCNAHGDFVQVAGYHLSGNGCPKCVGRVSRPETELADFLESFTTVVRSARGMIHRKEIDVYLPDLNIGIEYNGAAWHSERVSRDPIQHMRKKQQQANEIGIRLISISDLSDFTVVKKTLAHIIGMDDEKYFARKCAVRVCRSSSAGVKEFFDRNHLQGAVAGCWVGCLTMNNQIVCAMAFSEASSERGNRDRSRWELRRFASVCRVVGGASKLLKLFIKHHPDCRSIISYSDNAWFTGGMYEKLGFSFISEVRPDYKYIKQNKVRKKGQMKREAMAKLKGFDFRPEESEHQNALRNKWYRLYDCGKKKWELSL